MFFVIDFFWKLQSGVHVLLVSLFGIPIVRSISHFLVDHKNNCVDQKKIWYTKKKFGRPKKWEIDRTIGIPKRLTKSTWTPLMTGQIFFGRPKEMRNILDNWSAKGLTKTTWTSLLSKEAYRTLGQMCMSAFESLRSCLVRWPMKRCNFGSK